MVQYNVIIIIETRLDNEPSKIGKQIC